jgi:uncharacterized integral membrane protein
VSTPEETTRRSQARNVALAVLAILIVVFALLNLDDVEINWIIGTWKTPLIVAIAVSGALGAAAGWIAAHRRRR